MLRRRLQTIYKGLNRAGVYGLAYDEINDTYARLGKAQGQPVGQSISDLYLPLHSKITAGLLTDAGEFTEFNPDNWDEDIDGNPVSRDGSQGQVVVRYPKTYYKHEYINNIHYYYISEFNLPGFTVHPYFIKQGQEVDYRYLGAYEANMFDVSAGAYIGGEGAASYNSSDGDKLASVAGVYPKTNEQRFEYREMAQNRGAGFCQEYFYARDYISLMIGIEYADWNMQNYYSGLTGVSYSDWGDYNSYYPIVKAGVTDSIGTATGEVSVEISDWPGGAINVKPFRWRGLENPYGHLWKFMDGINVKNVEADGKSYAFVCKNHDNFADDTETNYQNVAELPITDNYIKYSQENGLFLPKSVGGSSSTYFADYYWTRYDDLSSGFGTDWRVVLSGSGANNGGPAGVFTFTSHDGRWLDAPYVGARLCY